MTQAADIKEETRLPAAYDPFVPVLEKLSPALAEVLRGQLAQFEVFLRSLELIDDAPHGDFEGLNGLTNRGDIEHILQSELLLQTEAPLEFLRRLAEAETLYHDRQYSDPGKKQVWRVVVSCGPEIMGHGRLVALAAVFFLAKVASERGGKFEWCFLPTQGEITWSKGLSVNSIKRFLRSAAFREASVEDVAAARELWDASDKDEDARERPLPADWIIGSARHGSLEKPSIESEPNTLAFTMLPQMRGEVREARISVRKGFLERGEGTVQLATDKAVPSRPREALFDPQEGSRRGRGAARGPRDSGLGATLSIHSIRNPSDHSNA
ncbi:MAG: hypothetical protein SXU28_02195 [Pseudomonadota bacterium]|nr:hypothetical protein [Pseudomonadota bacterium]